MSAGRRDLGSRWTRAAALAAALACGLGCGSERAEPQPAAPGSAAAALPPDAAEPAAPPRAEQTVASRRAREALSVEERRALWRRRLGIPEDPEQRRALREQAAAQDRLIVPHLDDEDAGVRTEAVRTVDLQGPGRERVFALSIDDPAPAVRAAAFERLYEEDAHTARKLAQRGLADRDPEVVLVAIAVLGVVGDASSVAELEPLAASHEDPRVRQAAAQAIESLR